MAKQNGGIHLNTCQVCTQQIEWMLKNNPSSRIWTSDLWMSDVALLQSTNWAIEGTTEIQVLVRDIILIETYQYLSLKTCLLCYLPGSHLTILGIFSSKGGVAQMVERSLSMREVPGSIPGASKHFRNFTVSQQNKSASSGNRTRAARVAGEHSTTEPTMLHWKATRNREYIKIL